MYRGIYAAGRGAVAVARRSRHLATSSVSQYNGLPLQLLRWQAAERFGPVLVMVQGPARPTGLVEVTPELRRKNLLTAVACLGFVGAVYMYSIRKLKEEDITELEEVTVVNMHESGLKATKFKGLLKETEEEERAVEQALEDGEVTEILVEEEGKGKGGGWKRWVFFWRKE